MGDLAATWTCIGSFLAASATAYMAWEMRKSRQEDSRPHMWATISNTNGIFFLVIKNSGRGVAKDITISSDTPIYDRCTGENINIFESLQFKCFPPQYEIMIQVEDPQYAREKVSLFKITIDYAGVSGKHYNENFKLDFSNYFGVVYKETSPSVEYSLRHIANCTDMVSSRINDLIRRTDKITTLLTQSHAVSNNKTDKK